jgi:hypothetical protein
MRKALTTLVALAGFAGAAIGGPATLPGLAGSAQAQAAEWTFAGPAPIQPGHNVTNQNWGDSSGRLTSVVSPNDEPSEVLVGSAGGGVWKSQDTGATWTNLLTTDNVTNPPATGSSLAIGSLWTNNDGTTIYAGTGELNGETSQYGQGVLKSVDGGGEWEVLGAGTFANSFIGGMAANRDDPSKVFAATNLGLYTSSARDVTWRKVTALTEKISGNFTNDFTSNGAADQLHQLRSAYRGVGAVVTVNGVDWRQVDNFANEGPTARVYTLAQFGGIWFLGFGNNVNGAIPPPGATIKATYSANPSGQVSEIHQDPITPAKWWATFGDGCRTENGGIATSDNFGATWNVPYQSPNAGRIGLGVGPGPGGATDSTLAYAGVANCGAGSLRNIKKSDDGGATWENIPATTPGYTNYFKGRPEAQDANSQGLYDNAVAVDPTDGNRAVFGGITILATKDGGASFTNVGKPYSGGPVHPDIHAFAFTDASTFYVGTDGGLERTVNLGGNGARGDWQNLNGGPDPTKRLAITQFNAGTSPSATQILGGTQDNGSPGAGIGFNTKLPTMHDVTSGDGGPTAIDPTGGALYAGYLSLAIQRWTGTPPNLVDTRISPCDLLASPPGRCVVGANNDPVALQAPYVMDPLNPQILTGNTTIDSPTVTNVSSTVGLFVGEPISSSSIPANTTIVAVDPATSTITLSNNATTAGLVGFTAGSGRLLAGTNKVYQTMNAKSGTPPTWTPISPDLSEFGTVSSISPLSSVAPTVNNTIFATTDDGRVWMTNNNGVNWANITGTGLPTTANTTNPAATVAKPLLTSVAFNPTDPAEAWVTVGALGNDGPVGIWHTTNALAGAGTTWANLAEGTDLPNAPVLSVIQSPTNTNTIYVGTYYGVWQCTSCGGSAPAPNWERLGTNLPNAEVNQLTLTSDNKTLVAWTYGRGVWTLPLS